MEYSLTITRDMIEWDSIAKNSPQGTIFSESRHLKSLNHPHTCYLVKTKNNEVLAGIVVMESGDSMYKSPFPFTPYQGILFAKKISDLPLQKRITKEFKITKFIIEKLIEIYKNFSTTLSPEFSDLRPFLWHNHHHPLGHNFNVNLRYTAHLNIANIEFSSYLKNIRGVRRQEFKKSKAIIKQSHDVEELLSLYTRTFNRQNIKVEKNAIEMVKNICSSSIQGGYGHLTKALIDGKTASIFLFLYNPKCSHYLIGANNPDFRSSGASTHLMLHNINFFANMGMEKIDFVGVNSPNRGDYKTSFGAKLIQYFEVDLQMGIPEQLNQ